MSSKELIKKDLLSNQDAVKLEHAVQLKERELHSQKMILNTHIQQLDIIASKSNDKNAHEKYDIRDNFRITDLEENIFKLKNENEEFAKKIKILKNKQNSQSKELEVYNRDKEYPIRV